MAMKCDALGTSGPVGALNISALKSQKEAEYYRIICVHRANVHLVWWDVKCILANILAQFPDMEQDIEQRIRAHDLDKFGPTLFPAYRQRNFPYDGEFFDRCAYEEARRLHTESNKHHFEYWLNPDGSFREVTDWNDRICAMIEMLCDWEAASEYNHRSALHWFHANRSEIYVDPYFEPLIVFVLSRLEYLLWSRKKPGTWQYYHQYA